MTAPIIAQPNADGTRTVSWSEIQTFRSCPHKHELQYLERWSMTPPDHTALGMGILYHLAMERHYLALAAKMDPQAEVYELLGQWRGEGRDPDIIDLIEWMYAGHVKMWGNDDRWEILAVEYSFEFPLLDADGSPTGFRLKGKIDVIVRDRETRRVFVVDHKSCSALPKQRELDLDDQMGLYLWGLRQLGKNPMGAVYSAARTAMNKGDKPGALEAWEQAKAAGEKPGARPKPQELSDRFSRTYLTRTPRELDVIALETLATARAMYSPDNAHERHPDTDRCKWMCGMLEACLIGRKTSPERERAFLTEIGFKQDFRRH